MISSSAKRACVGTVLTMTAFAGVTAAAMPAQAAATSARSICGSGYTVQVNKVPVKTHYGDVYGYLYLLYNRGNGYNCVTVVKTKFVGKASYMTAALDVKGGRSHTDSGNFKKYAGPVRLEAAHKCVKYWATMFLPSSSPNSRNQSTVAYGGSLKTWKHCR
ncbi:hypothetical protein IMZ11_38440 [Microtetraspora sp. AC03309]|uniref:spore-associated protein A n=1 Tax=Microtetraspora sp. AC03309 TaxID=2779376 RepID=UPI001E615FDD|nr:spore-associated protein A [Microtetraspora sp. AC03309]MCC5581499.1 hypothetical protein [Microtetraspora sp. AC03309]